MTHQNEFEFFFLDDFVMVEIYCFGLLRNSQCFYHIFSCLITQRYIRRDDDVRAATTMNGIDCERERRRAGDGEWKQKTERNCQDLLTRHIKEGEFYT